MRNVFFALLLVATMALVLACAQKEIEVPLTSAPYFATIDEAMAAQDGRDLPIIIDFSTDWCTWCDRIDTVVFVDSVAIDFFSNEMLLVKIDAEIDTVLRDKYHVRGFPTLVMIDSKGEEIDRLVGYLDVDPFLKTFRDYAQGIGTLDDLLNRADTATEVDRVLYMDIADKHKYRGGAEEAVVWFQKVIEAGEPLDSLSAEARLALADDLRRGEKFDEAIAAYAKIKKDFSTSHFAENAEIWIAIVYRQMGDKDEAIKRFQAFVDTHEPSEDVDYCLGQIKKLTAPPDTTAAEE